MIMIFTSLYKLSITQLLCIFVTVYFIWSLEILSILNIYAGFVNHEPKKIPRLFQDSQGPVSKFSRTKNHKSAANFHSNHMFKTMLSLWLKENKLDKLL